MSPEAYERHEGELGRFVDTATDPPTPHPWHERPSVVGCSPGGNGHGPMGQLVRLYGALLDGGGGLLRSQTVEALVARHRVGLYDHTFQAEMDWGLGFIPNSRRAPDDDLPYHYGRFASRRAFGHSGYRSSTAFADPEHDLAVAVVFNGTPSESAHRRRMEALFEAIHLDLGLATPEDGR